MALTEQGLGSFGKLARALGITTSSGTNSSWFSDPAGGSSANSAGLKTMLSDPDQRNALLEFVDDALGPPAARSVGTQRWVPLFQNDHPVVTVYAVVEALAGAVRIGVGVEHSTGTAAPCVSSSLHVPLIQLANGDHDDRPTAADPRWLLIGQPGGLIDIALDARFSDGPPVPDEAYLGGARVRLGIPTNLADDVAFGLDLVELQLPGATAAITRTLDIHSLTTLGRDVFDFVVGLVRAQAAALDLNDPTFRHIAGLTGILGLRDVGTIPSLPLADLPTSGPAALVQWFESVLNDATTRGEWLAELARLVGGTPEPTRSAVSIRLGDAALLLGLSVTPGTGGHPVLAPWLEVDYATRAGVSVGGGIDLLRVDTGTGAVRAVPQVRLEAIFGADSAPGAARLVAAGPTQLGSVHVGVRLDDLSRPQFALTLHDVDIDVGGGAGHQPRHYDLLDLSSPDAALDAVDHVVSDAISNALGALHDVGDLLRVLLGLDPAGTVGAVRFTDLLANPLGTLRGYWHDLLGNSAAMAEALGVLRHVLTGAAGAIPAAAGTPADPWRISLTTLGGAGSAGLAMWRDGDHLVVAAAADVATPVLSTLEAAAELRLVLLDADLVGGHVALGPAATGQLLLRPTGADPAVIALGVADLELRSVGLDVQWHAGHGFRLGVAQDGLALLIPQLVGLRGGPVADAGPLRVELPLPVIAPDGSVTWAPDWDAIESVLGRLLLAAGVPIIDAAVGLLGWSPGPTVSIGRGPRLSLAALMADPATALTSWAASIALDCKYVEWFMDSLAWLLSAGGRSTALGQGRPDLPWRAPIAGVAAAPGIFAWTDPPCPPRPVLAGDVFELLDGLAVSAGGELDTVPVGDTLAATLRRAAEGIPELADLMFARSGLGAGLDQLVTRWTGTDGVTEPPASLPDNVASTVLAGYGYGEIAALGRAFPDVLGGLAAPTTAVVHVGCDEHWAAGHPDANRIDATGGPAGTAAPSGTVPMNDPGAWFVQLAAPRAAAAHRGDSDGVAGQAAHLAEALAARVAPIVVVAYGAAGAAAIRAAATLPVVSAVVTVGTPWAPIPVIALQSGQSGDALTLLARLVPPASDEPIADELVATQARPVARAADLVARGLAARDAIDLPSAHTEIRRADLEVRAVFGTLGAADVTAALASLVVDAVRRLSGADEDTAPDEDAQAEDLHVGVDVPALTADLGGITVGAGVGIELVQLTPAAVPGGQPTLRPVREVVVTLDLGVTDGWLVGGPGATTRDVEVRWLQAKVHVPIQVGDAPAGTGFAELVLHDASFFAARRPRWVIRADGLTNLAGDIGAATTALPEVKVLLGQVVERLRTAAPSVAAVLEGFGLIRGGGLDPDAVDRLLFDTAATVKPLVAADPTRIATALNTLLGNAADPHRPASAIDLGLAGNQLRIDLAARSVTGTAQIGVDPLPPITAQLQLSPTSAAMELTVGDVDGTLGGVALNLAAATGTPVALRIDHRAPSPAATTVSVPLLPTPNLPALADFAARVVPAALLQALASGLRASADETAHALWDAALDALGLLDTAPDIAVRRVVLPFGFISDPIAWLSHRADPLAATVAVLEALAPIVVPNRGATPGWPLDPAFGITYAVAGGRLQLAGHVHADTTIDGVAVVADLTAGIAISTSAPPQPVVDAALTFDGWGARLTVEPAVRLDLVRPAPAAPLELYPNAPGLGSALDTAATSLLPVVLNAVASHRNDADSSLAKDVGAAVFELGGALDLLDGPAAHETFTAAKISAFAANPAALVGRLPAIATAGLDALADALDPAHHLVKTSTLTGGVRRFAFGAHDTVHVDIDPAGPSVDIGATVDLRGTGAPQVFGQIALEHLRLTPTGAQIEVRVGPVQIDLGAAVLRPIAVFRAGVGSTGFTRLVGLGVSIDDAGEHTVEVRWAIDGSAPHPYAVDRTSTTETPRADDAEIALRLLGVAVSLASGIVAHHLDTVVTDTATARLQNVVFTGGDRTLDPTLITDLLHPEALLTRLKRLAWNCATVAPHLGVTIEDAVRIELVSLAGTGGMQQLGLSVSLPPGHSVALTSGGDVNVALEVDASWVTGDVPAGLAIYALHGTSANDLDIDFGVSVAGIGLRFTKTSGPLLTVGSIALDGIAVQLYGEVSDAGVGGGVRLQLSGLAVAPGGGGGSNGMANSLVNDAGAAGQNNRPSFSPSVSIQKHPGGDVAFGLRAGDPPGPWWIVVQRQLGPIYMERIGFNSVEAGGQITRISLLFSGNVSLFGLTAAVDQLSLNWNGGDVLSISNWSADLMGLAVSADIAGVSLAGGLLKSTDPNGVVSYVGMLVGRFATYGLSVFGGYASDPQGHASFFVFGGVTGPIGGPPAFFLTGIGGGLGINRGLVIPTELSHFAEYPFIQALDPAAAVPDPMTELHRLNDYFPHAPGNFWFAAGISFNSFALVDGVAVVAVAFGDGLDINLLGLARMALPRPQAPLVYIELALLARFSTSEGLFLIKAQLTDNSWLLYRDIRLTGGFAFALWWKGPLAGQFVITLGGYHPDFHRDGYPDVPRLGLVWQISDAIVMKGGSYFALTSEALMAGTGVVVSVDFGWVWAKIEFGADGIVYFDPFFFDVRAYCRISAGIDIDLGLFSISMSLTLGASIHVWGPDFAGEVTFEIGPCDVPISFGPQHQSPGATISWTDFVGKYLENAGDGQARALSGITGRGTLPTSTGGQTGAPSADGSEQLPFRVFAEFEISFTTTIPITSYTVGAASQDLTPKLSNGAGAVMGLAPMGAGDLHAVLAIALKRRSGGSWVDEPDLAKLAANLIAAAPTPDGSRTANDAFPTGVWGPPKSLTQEVKPVPSGDVLITGNRIVLVSGIDTQTVGPPINYYQVTAGRRPLPLQASGTDRTRLLQAAGQIALPTPTTADEALLLAGARLFDPAAAVSLGAEPSALGKAAYRFDRVSPPRFGNLADGLARRNGDDGARTDLPVAAAAPPPEVRSPFIAAYLASGPGAARAAARTTVADKAVKRRPAPTTASVRGRLGLHLPAVLQQSAPTAVASGKTVVAALALPRTDIAGAVRTVAGGPVGRNAVTNVVGGLADAVAIKTGPLAAPRRRNAPRDEAVEPASIGTGDIVLLQSPDAHIDVSEQRPTIRIDGKARVVLLAAHGVVHDDDALDVAVSVPPATTLIAVQADGDADASDGIAGWHERSRVALISNRAAIGAGCTVVVEGRGADASLGWTTAGPLTFRAVEVMTRFTRSAQVVAIALTGVAPRTLDATQVHLVGGRIAADAAGHDKAPEVVSLGAVTVLVYDVVPEPDAQQLTVVIAPGSDWIVSGVLGAADGSAVDVAALLARQGLAGVTGQLTVVSGPGCRAEWVAAKPAAPESPAPRARTRRTRRSPR